MVSGTAFVILSCDVYSGLWETHFRCLDQYWPDCPFPKFILTNHKESGHPGITAIPIGEDATWSANLKKALAQLRKEYEWVLVTFDDLFLVENVNTNQLTTIIDSFHRLGGNFLQLIKWHNKPKKVDAQLGLIEPGSLYRPNCVYALWKIDVLDKLLNPLESAWEFERNGSARSNAIPGFYAVLNSIFQYRNTVIRGKIVRKDALNYHLQNNGKLRIMTPLDNLRFRSRYWGFRLFLFLIPRKMQARVAKVKSWL